MRVSIVLLGLILLVLGASALGWLSINGKVLAVAEVIDGLLLIFEPLFFGEFHSPFKRG
jgi:hypothetical protein